MNRPRFVHQIDVVNPIKRTLGLQAVEDCINLHLLDDKMSIQGRASRLLELNSGGFIPDDKAFAQNLDKHDHVDRVNRTIQAAAKDCSVVIASPQVERQFDAHFAPVVGDIGDNRARTTICRKQIERPTVQARSPRLRHSPPQYRAPDQRRRLPVTESRDPPMPARHPSAENRGWARQSRTYPPLSKHVARSRSPQCRCSWMAQAQAAAQFRGKRPGQACHAPYRRRRQSSRKRDPARLSSSLYRSPVWVSRKPARYGRLKRRFVLLRLRRGVPAIALPTARSRRP